MFLHFRCYCRLCTQAHTSRSTKCHNVVDPGCGPRWQSQGPSYCPSSLALCWPSRGQQRERRLSSFRGTTAASGTISSFRRGALPASPRCAGPSLVGAACRVPVSSERFAECLAVAINWRVGWMIGWKSLRSRAPGLLDSPTTQPERHAL